MKYKLISRKTNQETICDKVTIDGFEYYVSDTKIAELKPSDRYATIVENRRRIVFYTKHIQSKDNVVIATNNPNIDIPKVVDEVERLAKQEHSYNHKSVNEISFRLGVEVGYNKSQETHSFSEEDMIEFAVFYQKHQGRSLEYWGKNLFKIWKEQQPKTIYYE